MDKFHSSCPVRLERMQLSRRINRAGIPGAKDEFLHFEHDVYWLRESETKLVAVHGGLILTEFATYNDFYGLGTSVSEAIKDAEMLKRKYGVNKKSSLVIRALFSLTDRAVLEAPQSPYGIKGRREWYCVPRDWYPRDEEKHRLWLETDHPTSFDLKYFPLHDFPRGFFNERVIWDSKMTQKETAEAVATWQQIATAESPIVAENELVHTD